MSERCSRDALAAQLNTTFQIHFAPETIMDAKLFEVSEIKQMGPYESFTITFLVPEDCPIEQRMYQIDHPQIGSKKLFLVPSGKDQNGTTYVSVFNYSKDPK